MYIKMVLGEAADVGGKGGPHGEEPNHNASHRRVAERSAVPETRLAAAVSCGRVRAWHARKFARSSRPRKEFGRVDTPPHDRKVIGTLPGIPRGGFFVLVICLRRAVGRRHHTAGSAASPRARA